MSKLEDKLIKNMRRAFSNGITEGEHGNHVMYIDHESLEAMEDLIDFAKHPARLVDVEVESKQDPHSPHQGISEDIRHTHPSFGMIQPSRRTGSFKTRMFGSEIESRECMSLVISTASLNQHLGSNWFSDRSQLIEIEMTPTQYVEMISSPNTSGVPCTIKYDSSIGRIEPKEVPSELEHNEKTIKQILDNEDNNELVNVANEILNKSGSINKGDRKKLEGIISRISGNVKSSIPFYRKCLDESIDRAKVEANSEIEARMTRLINQTGIAALKNDEIVAKLLEDKVEK